MANKNLFRSKSTLDTNAVNEAGGKAYKFTTKHALAQYAATGCLNNTFYTSDKEQLAEVLKLCEGVPLPFIAKTAVYARQRGFMKDMPALLAAVLANKDVTLLASVFDRVIDNPKMLRNFCQMIRSGATGRRSFGSSVRRLIRAWLASRTDEQIFKGSVGTRPSMKDIIKMVHPTPDTASRAALYGYLIGAEKVSKRSLPKIVKQFEDFKAGKFKEVPDVPFEMLTALELGTKEWTEIAKKASWTQTRMNLNTFERHGVLKDKAVVTLLANRLADPVQVKKAKVFPYQLMGAFMNVTDTVPAQLRNALQDAMEVAVENVPEIDGHVFVFPDVSGSMSSPITGHRGSGTSKMRCIDIAALVSAAFMRKNPNGTRVIPFETGVVPVSRLRLNERDSVMTNATKLAGIGGGGTNCSAPLELLNREGFKTNDPVLVVYVSDNESWVDSNNTYGRGTATMNEWKKFKARCPNARMVCIDIQAYGTAQAPNSTEIMNIGGFSDSVFDVVAEFAKGHVGGDHWVKVIEQISLDKS